MSAARRLTLLVAVLTAANGAALLGQRAREAESPMPTFEVPLDLGEWTGRDLNGGWVDAGGIGADWMLQRVYDGSRGDSAELLLVYDAPGRHSHYSPETCLQNAGWQFLDKRPRAIDWPGGGIPTTQALVEKGEQHRAVFYWYQLGGQRFPGRLARQLRLLKETLSPRHAKPGLSVRTMVAAANGDDQCSLERAEAFARLVVTALEVQEHGS